MTVQLTGEKGIPEGVPFSVDAAERLIARLTGGDVEAWQLPLPIWLLWSTAYEAGRHSREPELRAAGHDADRLWLQCFGNKERREYLLARLDAYAEIVADQGEVERHLERTYQLWLASLDNIREPIKLARTTEKREGTAA